MNADNNSQESSQESAGDEAAETSSPEISKKKQAPGPGRPMLMFFIVGLAASLIMGWIIFPKLLYSQKKQPIDFNHLIHNEAVDEGCESCHFFREDGSFSGVPRLEQCIDCHEEAMGEDPEEIKFIEDYVAKGKEVPWLIYSRQPDCVFFSHAAHVIGAEIECAVCHGAIGESEHSRIYEENRLTGYSRDIWGKNIAGLKKNSWDRMKMDDCAACHQEAKESKSSVQTKKDACFVCHK